jgi:hypothetical protein
MSHTIIRQCCLFGFFLSCMLVLQAQGKASEAEKTQVYKSLQRLYHQRVRCLTQTKDMQSYAATLRPDFVWTDYQSSHPGKQPWLSLVAEGMKVYTSSDTITVRITTLRIQGNTAIVEGTQHTVHPYNGKKVKPALVMNWRFRETWINSAQGWRSKSIKELSLRTERGGKVTFSHTMWQTRK